MDVPLLVVGTLAAAALAGIGVLTFRRWVSRDKTVSALSAAAALPQEARLEFANAEGAHLAPDEHAVEIRAPAVHLPADAGVNRSRPRTEPIAVPPADQRAVPLDRLEVGAAGGSDFADDGERLPPTTRGPEATCAPPGEFVSGRVEAPMEPDEPVAPESIAAGERADASGGAERAAATENASEDKADSAATIPAPAAEAAPELERAEAGAGDGDVEIADAVGPEVPARSGRSQPAVHRDRRGKRRTPSRPPSEPPGATEPPSPPIERTPAEVRLRLALHPIRRTVTLSLVFSRPEGFPERTQILQQGGAELRSFNEQRYDDVDAGWTVDLLAGELRVDSTDGFQWVRSGRRIQIFTGEPSEADLLSVSAVRVGAEHAVICRTDDVTAVCAIARSAGSPDLTSHDRWQGIPAGWSVLSGYIPAHAAEAISDAAFRPLDPGADLDIVLVGGLSLRARVFAEGHPPRIEIHPAPQGASVSIGGQQASLNAAGAWEAPDWNAPGQHIVDVVPGPSLTYEIASDPANAAGWSFWDAHAERFSGVGPWSRAGICGARVMGPAGEFVLAAEAEPALIALGASYGAMPLQQRPDVGASVALLSERPAFLFASSGLRRKQGRVIWLGLAGAAVPAHRTARADLGWANVVYTAAARRVPLEGADTAGKSAWRKARLAARKLRRQRR